MTRPMLTAHDHERTRRLDEIVEAQTYRDRLAAAEEATGRYAYLYETEREYNRRYAWIVTGLAGLWGLTIGLGIGRWALGWIPDLAAWAWGWMPW